MGPYFFIVLLALSINFNQLVSLVQTNILLNDFNNKERIYNLSKRDIILLSAGTLKNDSNWFDCFESEIYCTNTDSDSFYPLYLDDLNVRSDEVNINGVDIKMLFKPNTSFVNQYDLKIEKNGVTEYMRIKKNFDNSVEILNNIGISLISLDK